MSDGGAAGERFVVQRAAGKKWETLTVHDAQADGAAAFASAVRGAPRAFLRLIRLQADPDARGKFMTGRWSVCMTPGGIRCRCRCQ